MISIKVFDKINNLLELYQRFDDSSFLFSSFDKKQKIINKGVLKLSKEIGKKDIMMVPDWKKDPSGYAMKDTVINIYYKYNKNSYWIESNDSGFVWKGFYKKNRKNGEWNKCYIDSNGSLNLVKFEYYKNGESVDNNIIIWPTIKGKWYQIEQPDSSIIIYLRTPYLFLALLDFKSSSLFDLSLRKSMIETQHFNSTWEFKNDSFILHGIYEKDEKFRVLKLDKSVLILKKD